MSNVGSAGKKRASDSNDDRAPKHVKTSEFGEILPHNVSRTLDKVRPGEILEACSALKARYQSDLAFVVEHGHIDDLDVAAMYDAWFEVYLSQSRYRVLMLTILRSGSQPCSNNTGLHTSAAKPMSKGQAR